MISEHVMVLPNDLHTIERAVEELTGCCERVGFDPERLRLNFRVGLTEALSNAMLYGNGRDPRKCVRVEVKCEPDIITIRVTDEGSGFDPGEVPDPTLPRNLLREGGRGIFLIRKLMDHVEFNEQGNSITMILRADGGRGSSRARRA